MAQREHAPLFVQTDMTVLLETDHPGFYEIRHGLSRFADLVKSPQYVHTYRMTPFSLWSAAASGMTGEEMLHFLSIHAKYGVPASVRKEVERCVSRYGKLRMEMKERVLYLLCEDLVIERQLAAFPSLSIMLGTGFAEGRAVIPPIYRGQLKRELTRLGFPVVDLAGFHQGEKADIRVNSGCLPLRSYQTEAVDAFWREGSRHGGSGVVVLPCGSGKTLVGIAAMAKLNCATLILTANIASVRQWINEIALRTGAKPEEIGEYSGVRKEVKPITVATYQILTHRRRKTDEFTHMRLLNERDWGLIVYDEVHLLPAPVFRATADIQATRRLGLTATLVREDGCEEDVFALIGPKLYEAAWRDLEAQGWIAEVDAAELRLDLPQPLRMKYEAADPRSQFRLASENPAKREAVLALLNRHSGEPTLIIGQYLEQLKDIAAAVGAPLISGRTEHEDREAVYRRFRDGELKLLVVSKVANFAVDLPEAAVAIQISGSYGSRQEEAQRLGRVLRPKPGSNRAYFYTLVTRNTKEQEFSLKRQLFLVEQGYAYRIESYGQEETGEWVGDRL